MANGRIYLIGSLRNPAVPLLAEKLRYDNAFVVHDEWYAAGPRADDHWQEYEDARGHSYRDAIYGLAAEHVFNFDKRLIDDSDIGVLLLPAGKSGHIELGYMAGQGKSTFILFDKVPERYDVMYRFATDVFFTEEDLLKELEPYAHVSS